MRSVGRGARDYNTIMFVYIIKSSVDNSEYVGMSKNPDMRLYEHNTGRVRSTKSKKPWKRIYLEKYSDRLEAREREKYLKSAARRRFRKSLCHGSSVG